MSDLKETCVNYLNVDEHATFCSSEKKWINKILALHQKHPDKVQIVHYPEDNGGMIYAHLPKKWIKVAPPRQLNYTEEQKAAMVERLAAAREKRDAE
jgi:hypothetical protein